MPRTLTALMVVAIVGLLLVGVVMMVNFAIAPIGEETYQWRHGPPSPVAYALSAAIPFFLGGALAAWARRG